MSFASAGHRDEKKPETLRAEMEHIEQSLETVAAGRRRMEEALAVLTENDRVAQRWEGRARESASGNPEYLRRLEAMREERIGSFAKGRGACAEAMEELERQSRRLEDEYEAQARRLTLMRDSQDGADDASLDDGADQVRQRR